MPPIHSAKPVRWQPEAASQFANPEMVADYAARDPYHPQAIKIMESLAVGKVLADVGAGCGHLTYLLAGIAKRVDAIDPSEAMLSLAHSQQPKNTKRKIRWLHGTVEDTPQLLEDQYGLVTAADSIHWTDWERFFPIIKEKMLPGAYLVVVERFMGQTVWKIPVKALASKFYTEQDQGKYDPVTEIVNRGYFRLDGQHICPPVMVEKTIADYTRERHSRNGCSRARMGAEAVARFDEALNNILSRYAGPDGLIRYEAYTKLRWGVVL